MYTNMGRGREPNSEITEFGTEFGRIRRIWIRNHVKKGFGRIRKFFLWTEFGCNSEEEFLVVPPCER